MWRPCRCGAAPDVTFDGRSWCGLCALERFGDRPAREFCDLPRVALVPLLEGDPRHDFPDVKALLAFEATAPAHPSTKARAVRLAFGISLTRYFQLLHRVVCTPEGMKADRATCLRVREELAARQRLRDPARIRLEAVPS